MTQPQVAENPVGIGAFTSTIVLEELFAAAVLAAYTAWLAEVAKLMLGLLPADPNIIWSLVPSWQRRTRQLMKDLENIARMGWEAAARDLGVDAPYDVTNPVLQDQLRRTRNFLVHTPDDVYTMILRVLDEHAGDPAAQTRAVEDVLNVTGTVNWPARAKTVAVTECLPHDALVSGANVVAAYRRWYEGDMVTVLTQDGHRFTGTPNHPMLTQRGWVGLGLLTHQDCLVAYDGNVDEPVVPLNPDVQAAPATIAQVFDAVKAVGVVSRIAGRKPDFHGDGQQGDVDVLCSCGSLRFGSFADLSEAVQDNGFEGPDFTQALLAASSRFLRTFDWPDGISFAGCSCLDSICCQQPGNDVPAAAELVADFLGASAIPVKGNDNFGLQGASDGLYVNPLTGTDVALDAILTENRVDLVCGESQPGRYGHAAQAAFIKFSDVIDISTSPFSGHVYNLSTVQGYFAANGLVTGNTHRAFNFGSLALAMQVPGNIIKKWNAKEDRATRPTHAEADGQQRPVFQPFQVGMSALMAPGDPSGPAHEVINCRCKLSYSRRA